MTKPTAGEVFHYSYLWRREHVAGETEGRKKRPVCVAVTTKNADGETILFIVPITTQPPISGRQVLSVPILEAKRAGLDTAKPCWVMLDELNFDVFEKSYVFEDRTPLGAFGKSFTAQIQKTLLAAVRAGAAVSVNRLD